MAVGDPAVASSKASIRDAAREFAKRYEDATSEQAERQSFWNDFFSIFGLKRRQVATFERLANRASTGNYGWIDLLFPGQMAVEHKSAGESLDQAMQQLADYLPALTTAEHPWLLVACDFQTFRWENLEAGTEDEFLLVDLADNLDLFYWLAGYGLPHRRFDNDEEANLEATALMAELHDRLAENGYPDHALREWLTRILFFMFADDTGVWERAAFHAYIAEQTAVDGSDLGALVAYLFQIVNTAPEDRPGNLSEELNEFTFVNGDLFAEQLPIATCDAHVREALLKACSFDWGAISPAIFGSMFQNVMTPVERRQLGAHYTSEQNILRTIRPLFLNDLAEDLEKADTKPKLEAFLQRLAALTFFDPACGCGNFLVVAYREIRRLETEALRRLREKQQRTGQLEVDITLRCRVRVDQFYGIEIEEFPAKIARTALYLMDHLANRDVSQEFGQHFVRFPIPASPHIEISNALRMDWDDILPSAEADFVFGNPPFVGRQYRSSEQKDDLVIAFDNAKGHGVLDYVTAWFAKSAAYLEGTKGRAAFVATNSVSQGQNVSVLWPPLIERGVGIDFAVRPFKWTSEARGKAQVTVVIVGFSYDSSVSRTLMEIPEGTATPVEMTAKNISPYLTDAPNIIIGTKRTPISPDVPVPVYGSMVNDGGGLIVGPDEIDEFRRDPVAVGALRPYIGTQEMLYSEDRWCLWLADTPPSEIRQSSLLLDRLERVRRYRAASKRAVTKRFADTPALFTEPRPVDDRFLLVPYASSENRHYVPMRFYEPPTLVRAPSWCIPGANVYLFGILASSMFAAWVRTVSGRLESRLQLSPGTSYNNFPFPDPSVRARSAVEDAAQEVLMVRAGHVGSTLADLYDPLTMPGDLARAHRNLDAAVDAAISPRRKFRTEADRLARLFELYQEFTAGQQLPIAP